MAAVRRSMWGLALGLLLVCGVGGAEGKEGSEGGGEGGDDGFRAGSLNCAQPSSLSGYSCQATVKSGVYDIHWAMTGSDIAFALDLQAPGWVAVGWSRSLQMNHADAVIGHTAVGGGSVAAYELAQGDTPESVLGRTTLFSIGNTSTEWSRGHTIVRFTRLLASGNNPIEANGPVGMIASWSADGSNKLAFHSNNYATFTLDLSNTPVLAALPAALLQSSTSTSTGCTSSNIVGYRCTRMAGEGVGIHWRMDRTKVALAVVAPTTGWVALGWAVGGAMVGAEVVIWKGSGSPRAHKINALDAYQIVPTTTFRVINQKVNTTATTTMLSFERELDDTGTVPWSSTGPTSMIWAHSVDGTYLFQNHGSNRGPFSITYNENATTATNTTLPPETSPTVGSNTPSPPSASSSGCLASTLSGFRCMTVISPNGFTMHWETSASGVTIAISARTGSWVSLGWSKDGLMKDTDAVVASDPGSGMQVSTYALTGTGSSSVRPTNRFQVSEASVNTTGSSSIIRFTRMFGDNGLVPAVRNGKNTLVWAMGSSSSLDYHGSNRGTIEVNFESGDSTTSTSGSKNKRSLINVHAWLMWIAFGLLFPSGVFFARFGQTQRFTPHWFYAHVGIQSTACVLAAVSFIIALTSLEDDSWHGTLGKTVAGLVLAQMLLGVFRVHKHSTKRPIWYGAHWLLGIIAVLIGFVTIFLGINRYHDLYIISAKRWNTAFGVNVGFFIVAYIILSLIFSFRSQAKPGGPVQMVQVVTTNGNGNGNANSHSNSNDTVSARASVDSMAPLYHTEKESHN